MSNIPAYDHNAETLGSIESLPKHRRYEIRGSVAYLRFTVEASHAQETVGFEQPNTESDHVSPETMAQVYNLDEYRQQQAIQDLRAEVKSYYPKGNPLFPKP